MTQTVEDACLVLEAMTGRKNAYTAKIGNKRLEGIRLLAPTNLVNAAEALDYGQKEKLHEAYSVLRDLGAEIIEAPVGEEFNMLNVHHDHVAQTQFVNDIRDYLATLEQ